MDKKCENCDAVIHCKAEKKIATTSESEPGTKYILIDNGKSDYIKNMASDIYAMKLMMIFWFILTIVALLFGYSKYLDFVHFMDKINRLF